MALCNITDGYDYTDDCRGTAGIKRFLIANKSDVTSFTEGVVGTSSVPSGEIIGITMSAGTYFYEFKTYPALSSISETTAEGNGNIVYTHTANIVLVNATAAIRNLVNYLTKGSFYIIAQKIDGTYWLCGRDSGMNCGAQGGSGTAGTDLNGYTITATSVLELETAITVDPDIIDALLA